MKTPPSILRFACCAALVTSCSAVACGGLEGGGVEDAPTAEGDAATASTCEPLVKTLPGAPARQAALLWAQLEAPSGPASIRRDDGAWQSVADGQIAIYADGRVVRTFPLTTTIMYDVGSRPLDGELLSSPPRAEIVARLAPSTMTALRDELARADRAPTVAYLGGPAAPSAAGPKDTPSVVVASGRVSCFQDVSPAASVRASPHFALAGLATRIADAFARTHRNLDRGTIALSSEASFQAWPEAVPLPVAAAPDAVIARVPIASPEVVAPVTEKGNTLFRTGPSEFLRACRVLKSDEGVGLTLECHRSHDVPTVVDPQLSTALLSNVGRYSASKGAWLGVEARGPLFERARDGGLLFVSSPDAGTHLYYARAIPALDLTDSPPLVVQ